MLKKLSAVAADIDGTLAIKGGTLMPRTKKAIQRLHEEGVLFGVASGRPLDGRILAMAKAWDLGFEFDFAIGMNGGDLYDSATGEITHYCQLKKEDVKEILEMVKGLDLNAIVYVHGYDEINALRMDDFLRDSIRRNHSVVEIGDIDFLSRYDTGKVECQMKPAVKPLLMERIEAHPSERWTSVMTFSMNDHCTIEFLDPRVNKGLALRKFSEARNIPLEEIMAFGDMENDIGLLREAGWGVCLENGSEETKAVAQAVTEYSVHEDGVGHYLEDHWFAYNQKEA